VTPQAALEYASKHDLHALIVASPGAIALEEYGGGFGPERPHALYSGTKAFWGIAALELEADGLIDLDAPVVDTIPEFKGDIRRDITPRMLLNLSSGYGFGGLGSAVPVYLKALEIPLKNSPGAIFTYGGIPLQVFGAYVARKLAPHKKTPHDFLRERVLEPAHVQIAQWRELSDGTHPLPTGAQLTARNWLAYGRYILAHREKFSEALAPSAANVRYGLGWWLSLAGLPEDLFYASGSAGQGLYIIPSQNLIVVHFGKSNAYKHESLLKKLLSSPRS
jgi:CubicO group peptidase (beta-lactamase class C family)